MKLEVGDYVFIGGRTQGKTRDLINQLISENKRLKNDYNKLVHESTEFESKVYQLHERLERIENYLDKNYTVENQYWFDHIKDIVKDR